MARTCPYPIVSSTVSFLSTFHGEWNYTVSPVIMRSVTDGRILNVAHLLAMPAPTASPLIHCEE